jgi:hypothetical protein
MSESTGLIGQTREKPRDASRHWRPEDFRNANKLRDAILFWHRGPATATAPLAREILVNERLVLPVH